MLKASLYPIEQLALSVPPAPPSPRATVGCVALPRPTSFRLYDRFMFLTYLLRMKLL